MLGIPLFTARMGTRGTETSKYPEEKTSYRDSVSSGERKRNSLNQGFGSGVAGLQYPMNY